VVGVEDEYMLSFFRIHKHDDQFDIEQDRDLIAAFNEASTEAEIEQVVSMAHQRLAARVKRGRAHTVAFS
jgi:hypothetical protein